MNTPTTATPNGPVVTLLDGGMGQELIRRSSADKPHKLWSLKVMLDEPQLVSSVHRDFCLAGARIACLNTYSVTRHRLTLAEDLPSLESLLETAADLAQAGIEASGMTGVDLIGSLPPLTASYLQESPLDHAQIVAEYEELIRLQRSRLQGFIAETLPTINEATAVLQAGLNAGVSIHLALTVDDQDGTRLRSGEPLEDALTAVIPLEPASVLINCSTPEATDQALPLLAGATSLFGAYANGFHSVEALKPGGTVDVLSARDELTPEAYAQWALRWVSNGATIVGGCCEVSPEHIAHLHEQLQHTGTVVSSLAARC